MPENIKTILVTEPTEGYALCIKVKINNPDPGFDITKAAREACTKFVIKHRKGQALYNKNDRHLGWTDLCDHVPDSICVQCGFTIVECLPIDINANYNTDLVDASKV